MLRIDNYTDEILKDISFTLEADKDLVILGANGAGKTTLAKVLCGIIPSYKVTIDEIIPSKVYSTKRAKHINYIPPKLEIFDAFITVKEFLELGLIDLTDDPLSTKRPTIKEILERLHIAHLQEKRCMELSSGESQLLLIASALLHQARYTIFDEPTANLDPQKMQMLYRLFQNDRVLPSKIIITHNLDFAYKLGYDLLFLDQGRIAFHGKAEAFFSQTHLDAIYHGAVVKKCDHLVVNL